MLKSAFSPMRRTVATAVALAAAITLPALPTAHAQPSAGKKPGQDFNGDGYADLATAVPWGTVDGKAKAGYVAVLYGSKNGLRTTGRKVFSQNSAGVPDTAEADDHFGSALTAADLDRDGYTDLVVGVRGEDTATGGTDSGYVQVLWGGSKGIAGGASLATGSSGHNWIGAQGQLATADVNGDGAPDLMTVENFHDLRVASGPFTRDGTAHGGQLVQDEVDHIVLDLAAGDLNGDGIGDVVATEEHVDAWEDRRVFYWLGTKDGLKPYKPVTRSDGYGLEGGENLAVGDVNGDGRDDVLVGRNDGMDSDLGNPFTKGGRITWIPGSSDGPDGTRVKLLSQDSPGVPGTSEDNDRFGTDVQVGDVDGDGYGDVVTGVPRESLGGTAAAGAVVVLRGSATGPTTTGARVITQNTANVPGTAEKGDVFGHAIHLGDANGDGRADLAVGAPGENAGSGAVWSFTSGPRTVVSPNGTTVIGATLLGTSGGWIGSGFAY